MKKNAIKKKGFTLVELICVIALLAILVVVAIPAYKNVQNAAAQRVADSNARTAYSIGNANAALKKAGLESYVESMIAGGAYDESKGVGSWSGEVNGITVSAEYSGETATNPTQGASGN